MMALTTLRNSFFVLNTVLFSFLFWLVCLGVEVMLNALGTQIARPCNAGTRRYAVFSPAWLRLMGMTQKLVINLYFAMPDDMP